MKKENFRAQDQLATQREHDCISDLQLEIRLHIERGNYAAAELCMEDMIVSMKEIRKYRKAKKAHDKMVGMAQMMTERGMKSELITVAR
ncbi:hypothetical protein [Viridibacillus sp. FSL H8-0123]|uniref:hypothetical protein n=1 Tax=Viridibacillus sp. FSL H8-0123 TaxID=1928922 RepID=UPI00096C2AD1|nr:hypothetical protein [Viridibacillus sp. FSL H8-0123]OMC83333.1 hypothetical protein BK130_07225 [Viridibacillus sp. FSL H8-0123]